MKRRALLAAGAAALVTASLRSPAQPAGKVRRVAFISSTAPVSELEGPEPPQPAVRALLRGLRDRGHIEGRNLIFERRSAEGVYERVDGIVRELLSLKTEVLIVPSGDFAGRAAQVTKVVPIVMFSGDPIALGLVKSLSRPGGNVTGLTSDVGAGTQEKRLELLQAMLPEARRIAFVGMTADWENVFGRTLRESASSLGLNLYLVESRPDGYGEAFALLQRRRPDAFVTALSPAAYVLRQQIGDFALRSAIPSSCAFGEAADAGCLMSYGMDVAAAFYRLAGYVDQILRGAKAADLPIEQPSKFELVINSKTARAIGVKIPHSLLIRADRVIE